MPSIYGVMFRAKNHGGAVATNKLREEFRPPYFVRCEFNQHPVEWPLENLVHVGVVH